MRRRVLKAVLGVVAGVPAMARAQGAPYPSNTINLVVPFAAGSTADGSARVIAHQMSRSLGQTIIVENRVGAGGTIAANAVARATPDGYTLLWTSSSVQVIAPFVMPKLAWDPEESFTPIGLVAKIPQVIAVTNGLPVKSFRELVAHAKERPGKLNYATLGPNTTQNLIVSLLSQRLGISMTQVPYTSAAQIYPDLIEGRVDVIMDNLPNVLPFAQKGQLRPVAVVTSSRVDVMPDVPTVSETALPDFEMGAWTGLVGPKGLPPGVVATLSTALKAAVRSPEFQKWLQTFGAIQSTQLEPQEFAQFIRKELAVWKSAAEQSGVATPR